MLFKFHYSTIKTKISFFILLLVPTLVMTNNVQESRSPFLNSKITLNSISGSPNLPGPSDFLKDLWRGAAIGFIAALWTQGVIYNMASDWSITTKWDHAHSRSPRQVHFALTMLSYTLGGVLVNSYAGALLRNSIRNLKWIYKYKDILQNLLFLFIMWLAENDLALFDGEPITLYSLSHFLPAMVIMELLELLNNNIEKNKKKTQEKKDEHLRQSDIIRASIFNNVYNKESTKSEFWYGSLIGFIGCVCYYFYTNDELSFSLVAIVVLRSIITGLFRLFASLLQKYGFKDVSLIQEYGTLFQNIVMFFCSFTVSSLTGLKNDEALKYMLISLLPGMLILLLLEVLDGILEDSVTSKDGDKSKNKEVSTDRTAANSESLPKDEEKEGQKSQKGNEKVA